jgi:hypothetical protein
MHPSSWFDNYGFLTRNNIRDTSSLQILSHSVIDVNHSQEWRIFLKLNTQQQPMDHFFPCHQQRISFSRERLQFLIRQFNKDILQNSMLSYAIQLTYVDASEPYWGSIIINPVESLESIFFTRFLKQNKGEKPVLTAKSLSLPPVSKDDLRSERPIPFKKFLAKTKKSVVRSKMFLIGSEKHSFKYEQERGTRAIYDVFASSKHFVEKMGLEMLLTSSTQEPFKMVLMLRTKLSLEQFEKVINEYNDWNQCSISRDFGFTFKLSDPWMSVEPTTQNKVFHHATAKTTLPKNVSIYDFFIHVLWGGYTSVSYFAPDISKILFLYEVKYTSSLEDDLSLALNIRKPFCLSETNSNDIVPHQFIIFSNDFLHSSALQLFGEFSSKQCVWRAISKQDVSQEDLLPTLEMGKRVFKMSCVLKIHFRKKSGQRISFQTFLRKAEPFLLSNDSPPHVLRRSNISCTSPTKTQTTTHSPIVIINFFPKRVLSDKDRDFQCSSKLLLENDFKCLLSEVPKSAAA